jgi:3-hydroxy-3-methylglutaryl CoA synthase
MRAFQLAKWGESGMTGKSIMDFWRRCGNERPAIRGRSVGSTMAYAMFKKSFIVN